MKKNKLFIITALVLVSVFAFVSCTATPAATTETETAAQQEAAQEKTDDEMNNDGNAAMDESPKEDMADETEKEETMDSALTFAGDAYNFELQTIGGKTVKLSDLSGKKVYIKLWASWCSICLAGLEEIDELYKEFEDSEDVVILTMVPPKAYGEVESDKFKNWFRGLNYSFEVLLDEGGTTMAEYGIRAFPTSVFIDTEGNLFDTKLGHVGNDEIKSVLNEMP